MLFIINLSGEENPPTLEVECSLHLMNFGLLTHINSCELRLYFTKGPTRNLDKSLIPLNRSSCEDYKYHKISCRKLIITEIIAFSNIKISVFLFCFFLYFKALVHSYVGPVVLDHVI